MQQCCYCSLWIHTVLGTVFKRTLYKCVCCCQLSTFYGVESLHQQHSKHTDAHRILRVVVEVSLIRCWSEKPHSGLFFGEHLNTPLVNAAEVIYQVEDLNAQVTKRENEGEKQLAILHDDNLLHANAHLNIPGNTSQIVVSDKYGLHNSSWLILTLQAHEHISPLMRFICCFHETRLYHYH